MRPLRVLAVISSSSIGGAERALATTLKSLDPARVETSVVCPGHGPMFSEYRRYAAAVWTMPLHRLFDPRAIVRLAGLIAETRAEVVHTHLWNADVLGALAARRARVPILVTTVQGAYHQAIGAAGIARMRRALLGRTYRIIYGCFDRVVAVARYVRDDLAGRPGIRVDPGLVEIIPNGLDVDRIDRYARVGSRFTSPLRARPRIVAVANLVPLKGHTWLLRAMPRVLAAYPGARCLLVGDGPCRRELEALARRLGLDDRVTFLGSVVDPLGLVSESDVFVLPSLTEGAPLALLEAMALGTPVVATRVGGVPEIVDDRRTGLLVASGDSAALADAMLNVLGDVALAGRLSLAGREHVRTRFAASTTTAQLGALYADLARTKGVR
jgi:glycosyltransferase involved in cell wall biosynthesis